MRFDLSIQQARVHEKVRRQHMWRLARAVVASVMVGGVGLTFGLAMDLHDARWSGAWSEVGHASSPFSTHVDAGAPLRS